MKFTPLIILMLLTFSYATFQEGDTLIYEDDTLLTPIYPLEANDEFLTKKKSFSEAFFSTSNYRGYIATWKIENDTLYLIGINSWALELVSDSTNFLVLDNGDTLYGLAASSSSKKRKLDIQDFFPTHNNQKIPALWFNNSIILGRRWGASSNEEVISQSEKYSTIVFEIENGVVVSVKDKARKSRQQ